MLAVFRSALELLLTDVDFVAVEPRIIGQKRPWQRVIVFADAHEPSEAHDRVGHLAAELVDHDPFDLADAVPIGPIDRRSFHLVASDQRGRLPPVERVPSAGSSHLFCSFCFSFLALDCENDCDTRMFPASLDSRSEQPFKGC